MTDTNTPALTDNPKLAEAMAKYGITRGEVLAPQPETIDKANFDQLATRTDPVLKPDGTAVTGMSGHTGPLMFVKAEQYSQDEIKDFKTKYEKYVGFRVYTIIHPTKGEMVVTHGIPEEGPTAIMLHLAKLDKGNLFQIGSFPTSGGKRVLKPIPVQSS